jgi:hypothetical protein
MKEPHLPPGDIKPGSAEERKGMSLAALIIALVGLFCVFIPHWKSLSAACAILAIVLAVYCISRTKRPGGRARMALWALAAGILGLLLFCYFLLTRTSEAKTPVISEPVQVVEPAPDEAALDKLQQVTDSTKSPSH